MTQLSGAQVYQLALGAGLNPAAATVATAIAYAESGWNPDAIGDTSLEDGTWGPSVGLWQIRSMKAESGTGQDRDETRLTDPAFNAQAMAQISGQGSNFHAWTTYNNGAYHSAMSAATSASGQPAAPLPPGTDTSAAGGAEPASLGGAISGALGLPDWESLAFKSIGVLTGAVLIILGLTRLSASPAGGGGAGKATELAGHAVELGALAA